MSAFRGCIWILCTPISISKCWSFLVMDFSPGGERSGQLTQPMIKGRAHTWRVTTAGSVPPNAIFTDLLWMF